MKGGTGLKHEPVPLAIIGGGAAGMFAAAVAAERKIGCLVFERKVRRRKTFLWSPSNMVAQGAASVPGLS